ncbi:hypothetical protein OS493_029105 [Desmophyllum pertusum]|uniref:Uncharacterized protein n=1 Tax=Desmophyllum pertusum TaxID=174260 RepID=A0A9W9Y8X3_9CNID|nr:hypothetical protein OS493_029105 [Desmophyllum pertusum]
MTRGTNSPLEILPLDVADELKAYAERECEGLLSDTSCQAIKTMLHYAAWHAANITKSKRCWSRTKHKHCKSDAAGDKKGMQANYQAIVEEGEISETLATT